MKPTGPMLAAVLIIGCAVANANVTSTSASLVTVYDDFRTDGPLRSAATGQHWILDGHGKLTASVRGGQLVAGRRGTIRAGLDFGSPVKWIGGTFELSDGPAPVDRSVVMLAMVLDRGPITLQNLVHLIISPSMWALQKRIDGGDFVPILQGPLDLTTGVPYTVAMEVTGDSVTVFPPQGPPASTTGIGSVHGRYGYWEVIPPSEGGIYSNVMNGGWNQVGMWGPGLNENRGASHVLPEVQADAAARMGRPPENTIRAQ